MQTTFTYQSTKKGKHLMIPAAAHFHNLKQLKRKEGAITRGIVVGYASGGTRVVVGGVEAWLPGEIEPGKDRPLIDVKIRRVDLECGAVELTLI
jgi:hypothetical protein